MIPVLKDVLPPCNWLHAALLASAMHSLLSSDITELRLKSVQNRLQDFFDIWEDLYGMFSLWIFIEFEEGPAYTLHTLACVHISAEHCTINLHLLLHMSDHVRSFGPLWTHSCFEFEAANFTLIKKSSWQNSG